MARAYWVLAPCQLSPDGLPEASQTGANSCAAANTLIFEKMTENEPDRRSLRLLDDIRAGNRVALAKAISAVESGSESGWTLLQSLRSVPGDALTVGITGAPGCGKSSLAGRMIRELRARNKSVGVVAVDPSSPLTGGAILGDRLRMAEHALDPEVFIRSLSSRGQLGGLAPAAARVIKLMAAAGKDLILVETVGTGQSEVEIAEATEVKIVVSAPGLGDDIQAIKSGVLEIADILVVNKGDLPEASKTAAQLNAMLALRSGEARQVPVIVTSATEGSGIGELIDAVLEQEPRSTALLPARIRRRLSDEIARELERRVEREDPGLMDRLCGAVAAGELTIEQAAAEWLGGTTGRGRRP